MRKRISQFGLLLLAAAVIAAAPPRTPVVPLVTVVKLDGTSVRGSIVTVDPDQVTLTPAPKTGPAATAPSENLVIEWKEIKSVSNGMTAAKALAAWKETHGTELCGSCHGERTLACATCKGTAHDPASGKDCKTCKGELLVDCKAPKCKEGKIPCPKPCLKLSEGRWYTKDGKRWRDFPIPGKGTYSISEGHLGQLIDTKNGGHGEMCPTCGGKSVADCATCKGFGKIPCATCTSRKDAAACPANCDHGRTKCETCKGTGLKAA